jgi:hypothetical protein
MPLNVYIHPANKVPGYKASFGSILTDCFAKWADASAGRLQFNFTDNPAAADMEVEWMRNRPAGAVSHEIGVTSFHKEGGIIQHTKTILLTVNADGTPQLDFNIRQASLHELGHALGIQGHSHHPPDIMTLNYNFILRRNPDGSVTSVNGDPDLTSRDRNTLKRLYNDQWLASSGMRTPAVDSFAPAGTPLSNDLAPTTSSPPAAIPTTAGTTDATSAAIPTTAGTTAATSAVTPLNASPTETAGATPNPISTGATGLTPNPSSTGTTDLTPNPSPTGTTDLTPNPSSIGTTGLTPNPSSTGITGLTPNPSSTGTTGLTPNPSSAGAANGQANTSSTASGKAPTVDGTQGISGGSAAIASATPQSTTAGSLGGPAVPGLSADLDATLGLRTTPPEAKPSYVELVRSGIESIKRGDYDTAVEVLEQASSQSEPSHAAEKNIMVALTFKANKQYAAREYANAADTYKSVLSLRLKVNGAKDPKIAESIPAFFYSLRKSGQEQEIKQWKDFAP